MSVPPTGTTPNTPQFDHKVKIYEATQDYMTQRLLCTITAGDSAELHRALTDLQSPELQTQLGKNAPKRSFIEKRYHTIQRAYRKVHTEWPRFAQTPPLRTCSIDTEKSIVRPTYAHGWRVALAHTHTTTFYGTAERGVIAMLSDQPQFDWLQRRIGQLAQRYGAIDRTITKAQRTSDTQKARTMLHRVHIIISDMQIGLRQGTFGDEDAMIRTWTQQRAARIRSILENLPKETLPVAN